MYTAACCAWGSAHRGESRHVTSRTETTTPYACCSGMVKCCATHPAEPLGRLWTLVEMPSKVSYSNQLPVEHRSIPASLHYIASLGTHIVKSLAIAECKDATPNTYLRSTARGHFTCLPVDCASASATLAQSTIMAACNHWLYYIVLFAFHIFRNDCNNWSSEACLL